MEPKRYHILHTVQILRFVAFGWMQSSQNTLGGRRFESRPVIGSTVFQSMNTIPQNDYKVAFSKWIVRLKSANGEYFEGLS
jgi:hypothetical protein